MSIINLSGVSYDGCVDLGTAKENYCVTQLCVDEVDNAGTVPSVRSRCLCYDGRDTSDNYCTSKLSAVTVLLLYNYDTWVLAYEYY